MYPGATITAFQPFEGHVDLFITGVDGTVWSTFFEPEGNWRPWFPIRPEIKMHPGATVTVHRPFEGRVDLFVTSSDGVVWTTFHDRKGNWRPWWPIYPEFRFFPGAPVTALQPAFQPFKAHVDLFITGTTGVVWSTFFEPETNWRPWFPIHPQKKMHPGAAITVQSSSLGQLIFLVSSTSDGSIWSTFHYEDGGWRPWAGVHPKVIMRPGTTVTVPLYGHYEGESIHPKLIFNGPIFAVDVCGAIWSTTYYETDVHWASDPNWGRHWLPWSRTGPGRNFDPRSVASVLYVLYRTNKNVLSQGSIYITGSDGIVWAAFWDEPDTSVTFRPNIPFWGPGEKNRS
jgi:hypothetical protein